MAYHIQNEYIVFYFSKKTNKIVRPLVATHRVFRERVATDRSPMLKKRNKSMATGCLAFL